MIKVLVVDSDINYLEKVEKSLKWHEIEARLATVAQMALKMIWQEPPDLIISSIDLLPLSGWAFCRLLKTSSAYAHIPFIFLTNELEINEAIKAFQLDAEDYLPKTISLSELAIRVHKRARKGRSILPMPLFKPPMLTGQLGKLTLPDILQFLGLQGEAWRINVSYEASFGQISIVRGIVLQAVSNFLEGKDAFQDLLTWSHGTFTIEPCDEDSINENIHEPLENMLLEIATRTDEMAILEEEPSSYAQAV